MPTRTNFSISIIIYFKNSPIAYRYYCDVDVEPQLMSSAKTKKIGLSLPFV